MSTETRPVAVAEGDRSVALAGAAQNTLIITGDRNTVEMSLGGVGAVLAFAFRWDRPRARRRRDRAGAPRRFAGHVDREGEVAALLARGDGPSAVNLYGEPGVGKTHVLVEALNRRECRMRHGTVYLDGRDQTTADLVHAAFHELYACRVPRRDLRVERLLGRRMAVLSFEDVDLTPEDAQRLLLAAPRCRLLVTSLQRVLFEGTPLRVVGLAAEHAGALAEVELGRPLSPAERRAATAIAEALDGHPLRMRQAFGRARDEGRPLDELEAVLLRAESADERLAALTPEQRRVAGALAVHAPASVGAEHLGRLVDERAAGAAEALEVLEARHDARSHSPRYSLSGVLAAALPDAALEAETERALAHFTPWAEARRQDPRAILAEAGALLALLERAYARGRSHDVIRLGRAIEAAYAWGHRWAAWGRVLERVLEAARRTGDRVTEGWALHQLGTRAFGLGDPAGARSMLENALRLREEAGDRAGAAATWQNLRVVAGRPTLLQRLSHLSLAVVAVVAALLIAAGGAAGGIFGGGSSEGGGVGADGSARLVVALAGTGDGRVTSDRGDIRCGTRCAAELALGTVVVLQPTPRLGSQFMGWRGDDACAGTTACRLRVATDVRVTAVFASVREPRRLTVSVDGAGTVVSRPAAIRCPGRCEATFERGRLVRLTATARHGSRFDGWSGDCAGTQACEARLDRARSVTARFIADRDTATVRVDKGSDGDGLVTSRPSGIDCGPKCTASLPRGSTITLSVRPANGSKFDGWSGAGCTGTGTCRLTLDRDRHLVARFSLDTPPAGSLMLTVAPRGKGSGSITSDPKGLDCGLICDAEFPADARIALTATPDEGSEFVGWIGGGCGKADPCAVTLDSPVTVYARFERVRPPQQFTLTTHTAGHGSGSISPSCSNGCTYDDGQSVKLVATPAFQSDFVGWSGACSGTTDVCVVTMSAARDVTATFEQHPG